MIQEEWSPEQIHGWMKDNVPFTVSHERIYTHINQDKDKGVDLLEHKLGNGKKFGLTHAVIGGKENVNKENINE